MEKELMMGCQQEWKFDKGRNVKTIKSGNRDAP